MIKDLRIILILPLKDQCQILRLKDRYYKYFNISCEQGAVGFEPMDPVLQRDGFLRIRLDPDPVSGTGQVFIGMVIDSDRGRVPVLCGM